MEKTVKALPMGQRIGRIPPRGVSAIPIEQVGSERQRTEREQRFSTNGGEK